MYALSNFGRNCIIPLLVKEEEMIVIFDSFFKISFVYKNIITFKLLQSLIFDYNVIQVSFLLRLMMKLSK